MLTPRHKKDNFYIGPQRLNLRLVTVLDNSPTRKGDGLKAPNRRSQFFCDRACCTRDGFTEKHRLKSKFPFSYSAFIYSFSLKSLIFRLTGHIKGIHDRIKDHKCEWPGCVYRTSRSSDLNRHRKLVHKVKFPAVRKRKRRL